MHKLYRRMAQAQYGVQQRYWNDRFLRVQLQVAHPMDLLRVGRLSYLQHMARAGDDTVWAMAQQTDVQIAVQKAVEDRDNVNTVRLENRIKELATENRNLIQMLFGIETTILRSLKDKSTMADQVALATAMAAQKESDRAETPELGGSSRNDDAGNGHVR